MSPIIADDNWENVDNQQTGNGISDFVSDVGSLNVWKPLPKPEAVEAEKDTEEIPEECFQLENEIGEFKFCHENV